MSITPFVVGQWVRGHKFYGRAGLIEEIISGNRDWIWLLGTRRIGKTSLLRQIEHLTLRAEKLQYFPLFWDFQGAEDAQELHMGFGDALLDAEDRLEQLDISYDDLESENMFTSMSRLRRKLRPKGRKLLLLCDEVEELIKLNQRDPSLLRKLRRLMQSTDDVRSVLASTIRLWALADERGDTSPFLHGFTPPLYIHNLSDVDARSLIHQANLPDESRPRFDDETVEAIRSRCDNHPYLIQLLCKRCVELEDLDEATDQVANDPMVAHFFSVDFDMLSEKEHEVIRLISEHTASHSNSIQARLSVDTSTLGNSLHRLEHLGYIHKDRERRYVLANYFFRRWLSDLPVSAPPSPSGSAKQTRSVEPVSVATTMTDIDIVPADFADRYQLLQRIGRGATGVVFKAYDTMLRTNIAVKILKDEYAANHEALERLRREIVLSRDLAHASIVRIYHLGDYQGKKYITMQWVDGPTLAKVIRADGPFDVDRAIRITRRLASALEAAHDRRVLHRDIKPQNILMSDDDEPHLTDFGLARLKGDPGVTQAELFVGTPNYASPEQAAFKALDERSDLYALGLVLFEMITGRRPFHAETAREVLEMHKNTRPPAPRGLRPDISVELSELILRSIEKLPSKRYQSARAFDRALESIGS